MRKFFRFFKNRNAFIVAKLVATSYFIFYLWSIQNIVVLSGVPNWKLVLLPNWQDLIMKSRVIFLWEPIASLHLFNGLTILISPLNVLLASILSVLVFINVLVAVYSYSLARVCNVKPGAHGLLGLLPGLLTGFACCAPTFIIALGAAASSFTLAFIALRPFLIPLSIVFMILGYWYVERRITVGLMQNYERKKIQLNEKPTR